MAEYFDDAIFFDNELGYLEDVQKRFSEIYLVKVYEDPTPPKSSLTEGPLMVLNEELEGNSYVKAIQLNNIVPQFSPYSGLSKQDIMIYENWLDITKGNRILLLDWDLTLSKFSDLLLPGDAKITPEEWSKKYGIVMRDVAIFYMGGEARFNMIRDWLHAVAAKGIRIGIITNNGACIKSTFYELVGELAPKGSYELICARYPPGNLNKGRALAADKRFYKLRNRHYGGSNRYRRTKHVSRSRKNKSRKYTQ